jgi:hypothetical protein
MLSKDFWINEENRVIKQGKDCLKQHLGEIGAQMFLDIYHIRRIEDCRNNDYTKWRQENPPEEDPEMIEALEEVENEYKLVHAMA